MATASELIIGSKAIIKPGADHEGHTVTIIDNKPVADGGDDRTWPQYTDDDGQVLRAEAQYQRKVLVEVHGIGADDESFHYFILPRQLDPRSERKLTVAAVNAALDGNAADTVGPLPTVQSRTAELLAIAPQDLPTDPMDPIYDVFRPSADEVDRYIPRKLYGMDDVEFFLKLREQRDEQGFAPNVMLEGPTQGGKSTLVRVMANVTADRDGMPKPYPCFGLDGSIGITQFEMYGQNAVVNDAGREMLVWMEGIVAIACRVGGLLNLAELNALPPNMAIAMHSVLDNTRRFLNTAKPVRTDYGWMPQEVQVNSNLWCWSSCNDGYRGTQALSEALRNRFTWVKWDYSPEVEAKLVPLGSVRAIFTALRAAHERKLLSVPVGTTAMVRFYESAKTFGHEFAIDSLVAMFPARERDNVLIVINDDKKVENLELELT